MLASGGFGANLEMVAQLKPELEGFVTTNAAGITGDGIKMAEAVGAATVVPNISAPRLSDACFRIP